MGERLPFIDDDDVADDDEMVEIMNEGFNFEEEQKQHVI